MTKRKQSLCQNKTCFDYQLNTLRISYFQRKRSTFSYVNIKRPTHKVGQVYTKIDIKPSGLTKERLAFMKTQMRLLYDDK